MSCGNEHFMPISLGPESGNILGDTPARPRKGTWGGRRPGAGAPKGNLNALLHGRSSRYHRQLVAILAQIPEIRDTLAAIGQRRRRHQRRAEVGAAVLIADLFRRVGEIVLHPENNHLEDNQDLLDLLRSAEAQIRELYEMQSCRTTKRQTSINPSNPA